ncbi:TlpA disulfide reductase family protein [Pedobacter nyackensis]|uniref:TlpA family protein disulfide reductase n=1 Tax=Pedobacter nyackensis TaxID=475255 RepID=UPI002931C7CB|nr:TlpA disulfide reductase family protein [Pedobacter nyackensis]
MATLCLGLMALQAQAQRPVEISGTLKKAKKNEVKLFKISDGKPIQIAIYTVSDNGGFDFQFLPEYEGFYLLGTGTANGPADNYKFYFKGGDKLALSILDADYVLNGQSNSKENIVLRQWYDLVKPLDDKSYNSGRVMSDYVDFFPQLEDIAAKSKTFLKGKATGNAKFDRLMKESIRWDLAGFATNYLVTPRSIHPKLEEYSPYYSTLKTSDFAGKASLAYQQTWSVRTLGGLIKLNMRQQNSMYRGGIEGFDNLLALIPNDTLKGDFVLELTADFKNYDEYRSTMNTYGKYILSKNQQKIQQDQSASLTVLKPGAPAFAFSYPDKDGKTVTMADLKGKVVLVDVWATWCGPCKDQIPHLKKLEEEFKGTDLQVISISVDVAKDKEKWLKMVNDQNLGGLQLFASGWGDLTKFYKITSIPRFLIFDKNGKIVDVDAPRPSLAELKTLLEKVLARK